MLTKSLLRRAKVLEKQIIPAEPITIIRQYVSKDGYIRRAYNATAKEEIELKPPYERVKTSWNQEAWLILKQSK
jgi:hypothetical protein